MRERLIIGALRGAVVACCVLGSSIGFARGGGPGAGASGQEGDHRGPGLREYAEELGLSDGVQAEIKKIRRASRDAKVDLKYQLNKARNALRDLLEEDSPAEASVMSQADKIGALQMKLRKARLRKMLQINKLLTPDQRRRFKKFKGRHRGGKRSGGERGCGEY